MTTQILQTRTGERINGESKLGDNLGGVFELAMPEIKESASSVAVKEEITRRYYFISTEKRANLQDIRRRIETSVFEGRRLEGLLRDCGSGFEGVLKSYGAKAQIDLEGFKIEETVAEKVPAKKKSFFRRNDYGFHFVAEGTTRDFANMENYLEGNDFSIDLVKKADKKYLSDFTERAMKRNREETAKPALFKPAAYSFTSEKASSGTVGYIEKNFDHFLRNNYLGINFSTNGENCLMGIISGDLPKIKEIARFARGGGIGLNIQSDRLFIPDEEEK